LPTAATTTRSNDNLDYQRILRMPNVQMSEDNPFADLIPRRPSDIPPGFALVPAPDSLRAVAQQESQGNPNAVSPKGAIGTMQTMPGTLRDPGFGVAPLDPTEPVDAERTRVAQDYLGALLSK
jgi:hypothetical protein